MSSAGGVLATSVTVRDSAFRLVTFYQGDTPPAWARRLITNPRAWASAPEGPTINLGEQITETAQVEETDAPAEAAPAQEAPAPAPEEAPVADAQPDEGEPVEDLVGELPEPPKRGAGSGRAAWAAYAESKGVTVTEGMSRDDIIAAVEA